MTALSGSNGAPLDVKVATGCPTRVVVIGEVDASSADRLERALANLSGTIELDCSGLRFADASFLRALNAAHRSLSARGGSLLVTRPSDPVRVLLDLAEVELDSDPSSRPRQHPQPGATGECSDDHADFRCPTRRLGICD